MAGEGVDPGIWAFVLEAGNFAMLETIVTKSRGRGGQFSEAGNMAIKICIQATSQSTRQDSQIPDDWKVDGTMSIGHNPIRMRNQQFLREIYPPILLINPIYLL